MDARAQSNPSAPDPHERVVEQLRDFARLVCGAVFVVALVAFCARLLDGHAFPHTLALFFGMRPHAAAGLLAVAASLWTSLGPDRRAGAVVASGVLAVVGLAFGLLSGLGIPVAVGLTCLALSAFTPLLRGRWTLRASRVFALAALANSAFATLGCLYDVRLLSGAAPRAFIAPQTAFALLLLGAAAVAARPSTRFVAVLARATPGAETARVLVPAAVLLPVVLGGVVVVVERAGLVDAPFGNALLAVGSAFVLSVLVIGTTRVGMRKETVQTELVRSAAEHDAQARFTERFRQLVEWAPVGISVIQDGRLAFVNRRIADLLHYERAEDMIGLDALAVIHPDDQELAAVRVSAGALQPLPSRVTRCVRRDRSTIELELSAAPGMFEGRPAMISVARDVTAELEAERAERALVRALADREETVAELNRSEQVHRTILRHLPRAATIMVDRELRYVRAEGSILHDLLPNRGSIDCVGRSVGDLLSDATRAEILRALRSALDGAPARIEQRSGDSYFEVDAVPIFEEARVAFALLVVHDVTVRRAELAQLQAMLQEIHHRVKNNLQMITSLLNLQARQAASDEARAAFRETLGRVRSMAILHDSLYQSADLGRIDMHDYVDKLLTMLQRAFSDAQATFVADVERVVLPVDLAIPCGLIVNELVTNALKHAFGGARPSRPNEANEIRVEMHPRGENLAISVIDNGHGLSSERAPRERESLGLTLVHDLSSQLRGRAEFVVAGGTRCTVTFPAPAPPKGSISGA